MLVFKKTQNAFLHHIYVYRNSKRESPKPFVSLRMTDIKKYLKTYAISLMFVF